MHEESQQNSEEIEWSKTLVGMPLPTFTIEEVEKHRQLSGKIQGLPITKTPLEDESLKKKYFSPPTQYTLQKLRIYLK